LGIAQPVSACRQDEAQQRRLLRHGHFCAEAYGPAIGLKEVVLEFYLFDKPSMPR